jgi:hypothetical protein
VSAPAPHDDSERLTAEERARLRPSVDAAALERFLARAPREARRAVVLHFAQERTLEDFRAALADSGDPEALRDLERFLAEPPPPAEVHPATGPGTVSYVTIPTDNLYVNVSPPEDDPELRALWDAIEPGGPEQ